MTYTSSIATMLSSGPSPRHATLSSVRFATRPFLCAGIRSMPLSTVRRYPCPHLRTSAMSCPTSTMQPAGSKTSTQPICTQDCTPPPSDSEGRFFPRFRARPTTHHIQDFVHDSHAEDTPARVCKPSSACVCALRHLARPCSGTPPTLLLHNRCSFYFGSQDWKRLFTDVDRHPPPPHPLPRERARPVVPAPLQSSCHADRLLAHG
jgi:hypothetical protein